MNLFVDSILWFGSLYSGYDDYTLKLFQEETGLRVPGEPPDPKRFTKRYEFLAFAARPMWIEWRCRKVRDWVRRIRERIASARPDLRLTITIWQEPFYSVLFGAWSTMSGSASFPMLQPYARPALKDILAEGGIDLALLGQEPGVEIDLQTGEGRDRVFWNTEGGKGGWRDLPLERKCLFRDANYLDQDTLDAFAATAKGGAFVFNNYAEDWKAVGFSPEPQDPSLALAWDMDGKPADGIMRMNCPYPEDGWWFESQLRIFDPMPTGEHYLEPFAHAVAELDALRLTQGGLFMDKCHTDELRRFALAFRALPRQRFRTVGERTDPVAVRTAAADGRRYFYLVNREHYPVDVRVEFTRAPGALMDLATGEMREPSLPMWDTTLRAYELRAVSMAPEADLLGFQTRVPDAVRQEMLAQAQRALEDIDAVRNNGRWIAGMDRMAARLRQAIQEERLAWLRRAVSGYVVRKAREERRRC